MLKKWKNIFLGVICTTIIAIIFLVGLWPLNFNPKPVLHKTILSLPSRGFRQSQWYFIDLIINVAGFIPFGFFFFAFLNNVNESSRYRNYLFTIILGGTISLAIELMQVYLPTRSSSLTDLICNILGTILGVIIFHRVLLFLGHHRQVK